MDYLSFDVGIKNLAYCVLGSDEKLKQWGIINLNKGPLCQVNLRKKCEKQATYKVKDSDIEYCCTSHKGKFNCVNSNLRKINFIVTIKISNCSFINFNNENITSR